MPTFALANLGQYTEMLHARGGRDLTVRFVEPRDAEELQNYFRNLSARSRYSRFFGALSELPQNLLSRFVHVGEADEFTVVATMDVDGGETIVGEARYAFHAGGVFEFGLSVGDHWQGFGLGAALMKNLECRAAAFGASHLLGDTLRSNEAMIALAKKSGFALTNHPDDWKLVRFEKEIAVEPKDIPCATWRLAAAERVEHRAAVQMAR
jgi:GNAT superfamily N-acetyltransferase